MMADRIRRELGRICVSCKQPLHPCISCHEAQFRRRKVETEVPVFCYDEPSSPPYYEEYYDMVDDEYGDSYTEFGRDYEYLEPEIEGTRCFCCGRDHTYDAGICEVFLENPTYWSAKIKAACSSSSHQGYQGYGYDYETEGDEYETEEDRELANLEATLSDLEEYLLSPDLSNEARIRCLTFKCCALERKIQIEECLSPLPEDIKDFYIAKEEIVEDNTTSRSPLYDDESVIIQGVDADMEVEQHDEVKVYPKSELLLKIIMLINKCGEGELFRIMKKAKLQDIGIYISIRIDRWEPLYMPLVLKYRWMWHVNYRAYLGNVRGKCALRPHDHGGADFVHVGETFGSANGESSHVFPKASVGEMGWKVH